MKHSLAVLRDSDLILLSSELFRKYGDLHWWPAKSRDEVVIGAILTQNTSWNNVITAIDRLKSVGSETLADISMMDEKDLAGTIRSSGFYNQKAHRLKTISKEIIRRYGRLENMIGKDPDEIKSFLSGLTGIGQETLDSIMLYALDYPVFVVDKYTRRLLVRLGFITDKIKDSDIKAVVEEVMTDTWELKNFHACIVALSKEYCRSKPECDDCPLRNNCRYYIETISP
ncbi:MAG: endonuclease III domain-containing protein [Thermoplasmata archaeon]